ncbi:MAG: threonine/serine exporter family protein [Corynebacterium sp.]|nr:threonine/serine exporter family protein [Corynebacterium sp.]
MNTTPEPSQYQLGIEAATVLRVGRLLMVAGSSGYRVMRAMKRTARTLGFDALDANVGVTQITCTFYRGQRFRTVIAREDNPGIDASRIEAIENLTHGFDHRMTAAEINVELDNIENFVVKRWKPWILAIAAGMACASFAILNLFGWWQAALVALAAACGQLTRSFFIHRHFNQLGCVSGAAAVAALSFFGMASVVGAVVPAAPENLSAAYVAAVLFVVPGFPLFSAMIDLARFDFDAGVARLAYAAVVTFTATFAVAMISWFTGLNPEPELRDPTTGWYVAAAGASLIGICGFALLFNCSRRMILVAASVGMVANMIRFGLLAAGANQFFALFAAGLIIGVLGGYLAQWQHLPRVTTTVPASVILIPGVSLFRGMYYLNDGNMNEWLAHTATAVMAILAIATGLTVARMLTDDAWTFGRTIDFETWQRNHS